MTRILSKTEIRNAVQITRQDLLKREVELGEWLENELQEIEKIELKGEQDFRRRELLSSGKSGREILFHIFDEYNPEAEDCPPSQLVENLFGRWDFDEHSEYHSIASDYILSVWERYNKLAKILVPQEQKLQSRWLRVKKEAFERDGYKCQMCGSQKHLCGHHIQERAKHPELAYEVTNIVTLCKSCHAKQHPQNSKLILAKSRVAKERENDRR